MGILQLFLPKQPQLHVLPQTQLPRPQGSTKVVTTLLTNLVSSSSPFLDCFFFFFFFFRCTRAQKTGRRKKKKRSYGNPATPEERQTTSGHHGKCALTGREIAQGRDAHACVLATATTVCNNPRPRLSLSLLSHCALSCARLPFLPVAELSNRLPGYHGLFSAPILVASRGGIWQLWPN